MMMEEGVALGESQIQVQGQRRDRRDHNAEARTRKR